jgi:aryl-alcohol dehydrogenase-like predicted oxidoreductase
MTGDHALGPIDPVIVGGWQLAAGHTPGRSLDGPAVLEAYWGAGFRRFDCADIYTGVEALLGDFRRAHGLGDALKVHTKYVPDSTELTALTPARIERAIDRSRRRLGVERLELVQFHWWNTDVEGYLAALEGLTALQDAGKIRAIGLTNFSAEVSEEIVTHGVPVTAIQTQLSLLDRRPTGRLATLVDAHDIRLLAYGSVAGGLLSDAHLDSEPPPEPHEHRSLTKYLLIVDELGGWGALQALLRALRDVADARSSDVATVASAYALAQRGVAAAVVGVRHTRHLARHAELRSGFALDAADLRALDAARARYPEVPGDVYDLERDRDGRHGRIMRYDLNREER